MQEAIGILETCADRAARAPAPVDAPAAADAAVSLGTDVGEVALEHARSRALSAMALVDAIMEAVDGPPPSATLRLFDAALAVLECRAASGSRGARCTASALRLVSNLTDVMDGVPAKVQAPRPNLLARLPRLHAVLITRLAPLPVTGDRGLQENIDDAIQVAGCAAVGLCRLLGGDTRQLAHDCVRALAARAAQTDAALGARQLAACMMGVSVVQNPAATAPLVPQCLEALVALASALGDPAGTPGSGESDDTEEGGDSSDDNAVDGRDNKADDNSEDDEVAAKNRICSRLSVLRICRRLVDCAGEFNSGSGIPALSPALLAPVLAVTEAWSAGPAAFRDIEDSEDDDVNRDKGKSPSIVAAAVLELLTALAGCVGSVAFRPHAGLDTPWVLGLLERAGRHKNKAVKRLAAAARKALAE